MDLGASEMRNATEVTAGQVCIHQSAGQLVGTVASD